MSAIDLDLVELRCRLRGWRCERNDAFVYAYDGDARMATFPVQGKGGVYGIQAHVFDRPRLTLADIVASPPEGWTASRIIGCTLDWFWSPPGGGAGCVVRINGPRADGQPTFYMDDFEGRIAAHRAVAELLVLLGEVES